jgi:hypothetical protein
MFDYLAYLLRYYREFVTKFGVVKHKCSLYLFEHALLRNV